MKILFMSEKSILDLGSGAAIELLTWLQYLTRAGHQCASFSFSCFDGQEQYPVSELVSVEIDLQKHADRMCHLSVDGIDHNLWLVKSTRTEDLSDADIMAFHLNAKKFIDEFRPDAVIYFGSNYLVPLIRFAKERGAQAVFYLGTGTYDEDAKLVLNSADKIAVPTKTLQQHYKQKLGLTKMRVIATSPNHSFERQEDELEALVQSRREKFVTMINPVDAKGGLVFINIANRFLSIDPSVVFLAVESRGKRQDWIRAGVNLSEVTNLWWIPKQSAIENVFRRTSVLIAPSIAYEAAGKVVSEAMVCGIPVIGSNIGGIAEQMRGAGTVIDVPEEVQSNPNTLPVPYVDEWTDAVRALLDDEDAYRKASQASLKAGKFYTHKRRAREVVEFFESLA